MAGSASMLDKSLTGGTPNSRANVVRFSSVRLYAAAISSRSEWREARASTLAQRPRPTIPTFTRLLRMDVPIMRFSAIGQGGRAHQPLGSPRALQQGSRGLNRRLHLGMQLDALC